MSAEKHYEHAKAHQHQKTCMIYKLKKKVTSAFTMTFFYLRAFWSSQVIETFATAHILKLTTHCNKKPEGDFKHSQIK